MDEYVKELKELIDIETISNVNILNPNFKVFQEKLKEILPLVFSKCEVLNFHESLLIKYKGKSSLKPIMFMNHYDVVEANYGWNTNPFEATLIDNALYGRGTLDTKGGLYCMLKAANNLLAKGYVPENDIYFESACNEETDGDGCQEIVKYFKDNNINLNFCLDEGGFIAYDPLNMTNRNNAMIGVAEKDCYTLEFIANDTGGHSSTPSHNQALIQLSKFIVALDKSHLFKSRLNDTTAEMFKRVSAYSKGVKKILLSHPRLFKGLIERIVPTISPTANALFKTTNAFTMASGAKAFNVLPTKASVICNFRISHLDSVELINKKVNEFAKKYGIEVSVYDKSYPSFVSPYNTKGFDNIENAINQTFENTITLPYIQNGASDSRFVSHICKNCYRFVPFFVSNEQIDTIHGANENVYIDNLAKAVNFYEIMMEASYE